MPPSAPNQPRFDTAACYAGFPEGSTQNDFPVRIAQEGAFANLCDWAEKDIKPPRGALIAVDKEGHALADADGNAKGGLRFPQISAPIASYGVGEGRECGLFGYVKTFAADVLKARYSSATEYAALVEKQVNALAKQRYITANGARELIDRARAVQF